MFSRLLTRVGNALATYLSEDRDNYVSLTRPDQIEAVRATLRRGDVILVEGRSRFSIGIKYLTQSTWSHSAIFIGATITEDQPDPLCVIEADIVHGVLTLPLSHYADQNIRICRPIGISEEDADQVIAYLQSRLGNQYDLKNVFDLARWLFPTPPIPRRFRRRFMSLGSGDPTRAICSTLIAQAFQSVRYPILPMVEKRQLATRDGISQTMQVLRIRHHSLFAPRDFDLSPYFRIVKPTLAEGFDHKALVWADTEPTELESESKEEIR